MKKYLYVVFRTSFIGSLVMLAFASSMRAQDPDQITAADVAGYRLSFSLQGLAPLGKTPTQQATLPGSPTRTPDPGALQCDFCGDQVTRQPP